ncbi:MAG: hypothetical protein R2851_07865 [Caldilineaceae bacterium]
MTHTPDWFVLAVNIVMALLIVGVAWFVWRRAVPNPKPEPEFLAGAAAPAQLEARALHDRRHATWDDLMAGSSRANATGP